MSTKLSVIIPAYNMEKYLNSCLKSVFNQTLKDFEVIIINDCSVDETESIINDYKEKYNNLKYVKNEFNKGVSESRNIGLENATGEYVIFLDSDDYIENNMFEVLYNECKLYDLDMAICGYFFDFDDGNSKYMNLKLSEDKIYSGVEILKELLTHKNGVTGHSWNKMIRRNKLIDNNLKYPIDMKVYEDITFFASIYPQFNKVKYINKNLYHYIERKNSAIRTVNEKLILDTKLCIDRVEGKLISSNLRASLNDEFIAFYSRMFSIAIHKLYTYSIDEKSRKEYLSRLIASDDFTFEKYNRILKKDYIYDKFHRMAIKSSKYSNGNAEKFNKMYKKLYRSNEVIIKYYKIVRPLFKLIKN